MESLVVMTNIMKKFFLFFFLISIVFGITADVQAISLGFDKANNIAAEAGYSKATETSLAENIGVVIQIALSMAGVIFLALAVYAGITWMTARGEEGPIETAKKTLTASVIGLIVIAGAMTITAFIIPQILKKTTGASGGNAGYVTGEPSVPCCSFCGTWDVTCPPKRQLSENDCKAINGKYEGLKPLSQCQ